MRTGGQRVSDTVRDDYLTNFMSLSKTNRPALGIRFSGQQPASSVSYYDLSFVRVNMF